MGESPPIASPSLRPSPSLTAIGTWAAADDTITPRWLHTATLLLDGHVLVTGGENLTAPHGCGMGNGCLDSAELFDPLTQGWTETGAMSIPRLQHTATLLADGTVLVVGLGWDMSGGLASASAESYDPQLGVWSPITAPAQPRSGHTATLLGDGTVLVSGGTGVGYLGLLATAELYDPRTGIWTTTGSMSMPRAGHTATLLADGRVLVVGGQVGPDMLASAEIFDPRTATWTATSPMSVPRTSHTATLLPNGSVLVVGGVNRIDAPLSAEIYDPLSGNWKLTSMPSGRRGHTATLLLSGLVLVAGGEVSSDGKTDFAGPWKSVLAFDFRSQSWSTLADMHAFHEGSTATLLTDGTVLVVGSDGYHMPGVEIFVP